MSNILKITEKNSDEVLRLTVAVLQNGGLVIFPSDTVYGLLVDATNEEAVRKLIFFKNRPIGKAISVFVENLEQLKNTVYISSEEILNRLLPGPFTVVLPSKHAVSSLLESEKGMLGVRIPRYSLVNDLVRMFGKPITATSANLAGKSPHYSIESLLNQLPESKKNLINLVVDAGKLPRNKPSTVVSLTTSEVKVIRQGDIPFTQNKTYVSKSPSQTEKIAQHIFQTMSKTDKPLCIILEGELGAGKTLFVKSIGKLLGVYNIVSPTFVIYYEYSLQTQPYEKLIHFDLYQIEEEKEYQHFGIENMLKEKNVLFFEWGEKSTAILPLLQKYAQVVFVKIKYVSQTERSVSLEL